MKRHEIFFSIIKIPLDFLIVYFGFFIARKIRMWTDLIPWLELPIQTLPENELSIFALFWALLYIIVFAIHGLYNIQITHSKIKEFWDIVRYSIYWFLFFSVAVYLWKWFLYDGTEIPRLIILFTSCIAAFFSIFTRIFLNNIQALLLKKWHIPKRKLILIHNKNDQKLKEIYEDIKESKVYKVIGYISEKKQKNCNIYKYLWSVESLEKIMRRWGCDEILYIDSIFSKKDLFKIWDLSKTYGVRYRYITNSFDVTKSNITLSLINKTPVIEIKNTPLENWGRVIKRGSDIFGSIIGIFLTFPLMFFIALLIKIEDPSGPIIYKNRRIGQWWKTFDCYKFRYLKWEYCTKESYGNKKDDPALLYEQELIRKNNTRKGPLYKIENDPRKTKIGTFIEKYSIDEIPQFFNVLKGNMSLVGPRPHQPREVSKYKEYQKRLLTIKPGITWMAQVNGRDTNNFVKEAKLDIFYIENRSLLLDMKILFKTCWIILKRK